MTLVGQSLPMNFLQLMFAIFGVIVDIGIIASGSRYTPAIIPFLFVFFYILQHFYLRTSRQLRHLDLETKSPLYTLFTETSNGIAHIRAFRWSQQYTTHSITLLDQSQKSVYNMYSVQQWIQLVVDLVVMFVAVSVVALALLLRGSPGTTQPGVGLALINLISFSQVSAHYINRWVEIETSLGAIGRVKSFSEKTPLEEEDGLTPELSEQLANWPTQGRVTFTHMNAKYKYVQRDLSLYYSDANIG